MELSNSFINSQLNQPSLARFVRPSIISIDHDVTTFIEMGYNDKLIEKVYNILYPRDINEAINFMTKENNLYNHPFHSGGTRKSNLLCIICNEPFQNQERHNVLGEEENINSRNEKNVDNDIDYFTSLNEPLLSNNNQGNDSSIQGKHSPQQITDILNENI